MDREKDYSLVLLAGGKSSRMGTNKAELLYQGRTFVENILDKAEMTGIRKKYLSGFKYPGKDTVTIWDEYPEQGPLGGLHACLKNMETPYCLLLPVDVPQIPIAILEKLLEAHEAIRMDKERSHSLPLVLEHGDFVEPLIGIYPAEMAQSIENVIKMHSMGVFRFIKQWGYDAFRAEIPGWQTENINTVQAYDELLLHIARP